MRVWFGFELAVALFFMAAVLCSATRYTKATQQEVSLRAPGKWEPVESGVTVSLRGAAVARDGSLWASGAKGTVLRSIDGGQNWKTLQVPLHAETDFRDIEAWDAEQALIMAAGAPPVLLRTDDGGESWHEVLRHPDSSAFFDAVAFRDADHGWAVADPIDGRLEIYETRDAGRTWKSLDAAQRPLCAATEHLFAASGTCLVAQGEDAWLIGLGGVSREGATNAELLRFAPDSGWSRRETPLSSGALSGIFSLAVSGESECVLVGGDYQQEEVGANAAAFSTDGGVSWQPSTTSVSGFRSSVCMFRQSEQDWWIACGPNGFDISNDAGRNWQQLDEPGYHAMAIDRSGKLGLAVGSQGRVARWIANP